MTCEQIIENANKRTERRGEKILDMQAELLSAIQEFCQSNRFYWRRKSAVFNTVAGTNSYDLTDSSVLSNPITDFEQVSQAALHIYNSDGTRAGDIDPEFDVLCQEDMSENQLQGTPTKYFITGFCTVVLALVPDAVYSVRVPYWANPGIDPSQLSGAVPLVPARLHHILQKKLEAQVFRYTLGEGSAKYTATMGEYNALVSREAGKDNFAPGAVSEWRDDDCTDAVQSTR